MVTIQAAIVAMTLLGAGQTVLLDFYSDGCGPCREMNPTVEALVTAGYPVERINISRNSKLAIKYGVRSVPCFVMIVNGREVDRVVGKTSKGQLEQMCRAGMSATASSRAPLLAMNGAPPQPQTQRIPSLASLPTAAASNVFPTSASLEPWNPSIPVQPISAVPQMAPAGVSDAELLAASVRLHVEDPDGRSCGSGTIVDNRGNEALVLTCAHIFRDSQGKGPIEVELFGPNGVQRVIGLLVWPPKNTASFAMTAPDVALVAIRVPGPVTVARVAPADYRISSGMPVASVGCNNGDDPTVQHSQITSLNKFLGPPNVQVAGQPVQGRSGGGLFSSEGYIIGVCNAADPSDREGLFASLQLIHTELDRAQLAFIYNAPNGSLAGSPSPAAVSPPMPMPGPSDFAATATSPSAVVPASAIEPIETLQPHEQAALDELRRYAKDGAEVVCIVRPRGNPDAKSEVIVLDHASPELIKRLSADSRQQDQQTKLLTADGRRQDRGCPTSLELPKPRNILLEWSRPAAASASNAGSINAMR